MQWNSEVSSERNAGIPLREVILVAAVALFLVGLAVPRVLLGVGKPEESALAKSLHAVEMAKDAFVMERGLKIGTSIELGQLIRSGYLRETPKMPAGLVIHPGKVGEAVHFDESKKR